MASEGAQGFLEECHRILRTMGIMEMSGVGFNMFQLRGAAYQWWRVYDMGIPADVAPLSWAQFLEMFLRELVPQSFGMHGARSLSSYARALCQLEYAVRFSGLARHAPVLVATIR